MRRPVTEPWTMVWAASISSSALAMMDCHRCRDLEGMVALGELDGWREVNPPEGGTPAVELQQRTPGGQIFRTASWRWLARAAAAGSFCRRDSRVVRVSMAWGSSKSLRFWRAGMMVLPMTE